MGSTELTEPQKQSECLYFNARIFTSAEGDDDGLHDSMLVRDGKVVWVGAKEECLARATQVRLLLLLLMTGNEGSGGSKYSLIGGCWRGDQRD